MTKTAFQELRDVFKALRDPETGCPWDLKQTHVSLLPYLIEEAYEYLEAVRHHPDSMQEELGDVLLQIMLHSQIAEDRGAFTIEDVMRTLSKKMIHRHPHVFSDTNVDDADEVLKNWNAIKQDEKAEKGTAPFEDIGISLPSLLHAQELGKKAVPLGLDWSDTSAVLDKLNEELTELAASTSDEERQEEFGDILFTIAQYARHMNINAEVALQESCMKFRSRVTAIEKKSSVPLKNLSDKEREELWSSVKEKET